MISGDLGQAQTLKRLTGPHGFSKLLHFHWYWRGHCYQVKNRCADVGSSTFANIYLLTRDQIIRIRSQDFKDDLKASPNFLGPFGINCLRIINAKVI
jgi:hypothetical protein